MRWRIIRTLLWKEVLRQLANRGGIVLAALLVAAALLMTHFAKDGGQAGVLTGGLEMCFIDYWKDDAWVKHLRNHVPPDLKRQIRFRQIDANTPDRALTYPVGAGAIQMRPLTDANGQRSTKIWLWDSDSDGSALAPYELWFWRESARYFQEQMSQTRQANDPLNNSLSATFPGLVEHERSRLKGGFDMRLSVTSGLILFAMFFSCVYLLPSLMCEEHERGLLLAQALSPASPLEILAAKFLFYPVAGVGLAALLAGISKPAVLANPFFWLVLVVASLGSLGIGLTIACIARTQRTASMGALCYMLVVTLFLFICQQGSIPLVPNLALEYHCPRMLHAVLADAVTAVHWINLLAAAGLALGWNALAAILFRERGWQ
ncbi:MAG TPA: ABC transporter permease [Pirellulaceae bacterium]|nr:ABC transporter permease [Pirellulaceae bacterium]